jgi:diguanylate cyclase (GGDEF)-like protein
VAERIRLAVFSDPIRIGDSVINITASLGVVQAAPDDSDLAAVLAKADDALFRAKSAGRNQVSF